MYIMRLRQSDRKWVPVPALVGHDGKPGANFIPSISDDGILTWTNDQGLENPPPVDLKKYISGQGGGGGQSGQDGVSCTHEWDGTVLIITSASGTSSADLKGDPGQDGYTPQKGVDYFDGAPGKDGQDGQDGQPGKDGHTPQKGTDYWTVSDKAEMVSDVLEALPTWSGGSY